MTWGKYCRLLVVLTVPLLLIGGIFAMYVLKDERYAFIRCENAGIFAPNCRQTNFGGAHDMWIEKQHPAWFDLKIAEYEANAFPSISASGSQMVLDGAEIVSVEPYMGTAETDGSPVAKLREMAVSREPITIIFGVGEGLPRGLDALGCNELDISRAPSTYVAGLCGVPNGVAFMTFHPNAEGKAYLEELQRSVTEQAEKAKSQLLWSYLILIPSFLTMFLLGSLMIWIGKRTASYVSAG